MVLLVSDDVKLQLAKDGVCETIYRLLETYKTLANTSEARALMKLACDLIVLILTGGMISRMSREKMLFDVRRMFFHSNANFFFIQTSQCTTSTIHLY